MEQTEKQRGLRTDLLKFIIGHGMSVREFEENAERTRLRERKNLIKVEQHICLWQKYKWL
jgi:hypothetical protein